MRILTYREDCIQTWVAREYTDKIPSLPLVEVGATDSKPAKDNRHPLHTFLPKKLLRWADGKSLAWLRKNHKKAGFTLNEAEAAYRWEKLMRELPKTEWGKSDVSLNMWMKALGMIR